MDYAIADLKSRMQATIELYGGIVPKEDVKAEIKAYIDAINILELYYYEEKRTSLEAVLSSY